MKEKVERPDATGAHDGYAGPGTYILQDGERIRVDQVDQETLNPEPESVAKTPEKTKPASESAKKVVAEANLTE